MQLSKALSYSLSQLLAEKQRSSYQLSGKSAVPTSTISNIILCHGKSCTVVTIYDLCRGFNVKIGDLFSSALFDFENIDDNG